jgi:hypothetical protein
MFRLKHSLLFSAKQEPANLFDQVARADLPYHVFLPVKLRGGPATRTTISALFRALKFKHI